MNGARKLSTSRSSTVLEHTFRIYKLFVTYFFRKAKMFTKSPRCYTLVIIHEIENVNFDFQFRFSISIFDFDFDLYAFYKFMQET